MFQLILLLAAGYLSVCGAEVFYVSPTLRVPQNCPSPCHSLNEYAQNISLLARNTNISLVFLEGVHDLNYSFIVTGLSDSNPNISVIMLRGNGVRPGMTVINLQSQVFISFNDVINVRLQNIRLQFEHYDAVIAYFNNYFAYGNFIRIPHISYQNVQVVEHHQVENENIVVLSDSSINSSECNFTNSIIEVHTPPENSSNGFGGLSNQNEQSCLAIQNSFLANLQVLCRDSECNVTIKNTDLKEIVTDYVESLTIQSSRFVGGLYGLTAKDPTNLLIQGCHFQNFQFNIVTQKSPNNFNTEIKIQDCRFVGGQFGVFAVNHTNLSVQGCSFQNVELDNIYSVQSQNILNTEIKIQDCRFVGGQFGVFAVNHTNLSVQGCSFQNVESYSIYSVQSQNILNTKIKIQDCRFVGGQFGVFAVNHTNLSVQGCSFQNVESYSIYSVQSQNILNTKIKIQDCRFVGGQFGVLAVNHTNLSVQGCSFQNVESYSIYSVQSQNILNTKIKIQDCRFVGGRYGVYLHMEDNVIIENTTISKTDLGIVFSSVGNGAIVECSIQDNIMGVSTFGTNLTILNTNITLNSFGLSILESELSGSRKEQKGAFINSSIFSSNKDIGLLLVDVPSDIVISGCSFYENRGTPIIAYETTFELRNENIFRDNTVERGGGLALYQSEVIFGSGSNTEFINNTAEEFGGAIYIATYSILSSFHELLIVTETQFQNSDFNAFIRQNCFYSSGNKSSITFVDNTASLGGFDIYGATVYTENCDYSVFNFSNKLLDPYRVSSDPTRVCFCIDNTPRCDDKTYLMINETRYPGETFTISVAMAGYNFGRVAGSVYTNVLGRDYKDVIAYKSEHLQFVDLMDCSDLRYTITSDKTRMSIVLVLTAQEQITLEHDKTNFQTDLRSIYSERCSDRKRPPCTSLLTTPIYINVTLQDCPLGFVLDRVSEVCSCDNNVIQLTGSNQFCDLKTGYITRAGTVWLGVDTSENNTDIYYWHRYCPSDYCMHDRTPIDLADPDQQCNLNRSGVLCGKCRTNYSLSLGGNKCIPDCNNNYIALLIAFAALGILLVAAIKVFDLTVSSGTVSGFIFYANVVWSNKAILFTLQDRQSIGYYIITVPIAWSNLDFGIETCFSENLNQLTKTGLQFVFPVYIWCIAGLIIIICHYSTRATKLFGNNSVAVLATLFLLSYGKLFRNIIDVFTFADITGSNNKSHKVWSIDGNVPYGETPGHAILIVVALLFLILFLLPFTLILLFVPILRAKSHLRPLRWINTLKPFFDSYYGPFKDKKQHQVWSGILLISRVLILVVFAATSTYSPNANILLMAVIATLLQSYNAMVGLLYKKWSLSLLENAYIVNLIILGGAFLFSDSENNNLPDKLSPAATTSVVIALFVFLCTVIIYTAKRIIPVEKIHQLMHSKAITINPGADQPVLEAQAESSAPTVQVVELKKYDSSVFREELLETLP